MKQEKKSKLRKLIGLIRGLFSSFRRTDQAGDLKPPEKHKAYGAYFKKVEGSDLYTLFGDDRWEFPYGFPIERKRGKKLSEKLRKLDETEDFIPQMVVSRRKP